MHQLVYTVAIHFYLRHIAMIGILPITEVILFQRQNVELYNRVHVCTVYRCIGKCPLYREVTLMQCPLLEIQLHCISYAWLIAASIKHHLCTPSMCICSHIFCQNCTAHSISLPSSKKPVRVCNSCYSEHTSK